MQKFSYVFINGLFIYFLYAGFIQGDKTYQDYAGYFIYGCALLSILAYFVYKDNQEENIKIFLARTIDYRLDFIFDTSVCIFLLFYGQHMLSAAYLIVTLVSGNLSIQALKFMKELNLEKEKEQRMKFF